MNKIARLCLFVLVLGILILSSDLNCTDPNAEKYEVGTSSGLQLPHSPRETPETDQNIVKPEPNVARFIDDKTYACDLAISGIFGSCIDVVQHLRVACCEGFFCCPLIFVSNLVSMPLFASIRACSIETTPHMERRVIHDTMRCESLLTLSQAMRPKRCCCGNKQEAEEIDKKEVNQRIEAQKIVKAQGQVMS